MKNIHLIPTDKPSRLYYNDTYYKDVNSTIAMDWYISSAGYKPYNIYITNLEEIKEGVDQWYLDKVLNEPYNSGGAQYSSKQNVIILTTDQDLIKDGVQAIDDEFLEWFVKNPSCEEVIIEHIPNNSWGFDLEEPMSLGYKIIIPQEEPEILDEAKQRAANYMSLKGALDTQYVDFSNPNADKISSASTTSFKQERMYSEGEVEQIFNIGQMIKNYGDYKPLTFKEALEQFKKK